MKRTYLIIFLLTLTMGIPSVMADEAPVPEDQPTQEDSQDSGQSGGHGSSTGSTNPEVEQDPTQGGGEEVVLLPDAKAPQYSGQNVEIDPNTGSASTAIAIAVPPGRAGIQPNLAVVYNSSLKNGPLGIGWTLELGSIQRSLKKGSPKYDTSDTFELMQNGSRQEIVYDSQAGFYRPETEGAFMRIDRVTSGGDSWVVTDRKGIKYYFGQTSDSQEYSDPAKVFKWYLEKVEDVNGNAMKIYYWKNDNKFYPSQIRYTYHAATGLSESAIVEFVWENRPDVQFSYASGFLQFVTSRLKEIRVWAGSSGPRTYRFGYSLSTATQHSLLMSIQQVGADGASVLPATTFQYHNEKGFELASGWTIPSGMMFSEKLDYDTDWGARIADINGDAYPDEVKSYTPCNPDSGPTQRKTYFYQGVQAWVDGAGQWDFPSSPQPPGFVQSCSNYTQDKGVRLADLDGDGWTDMLWAVNNGGAFTTQAYLNNHTNNWTAVSAWNLTDSVAFSKYQGNDSSIDLGTQIVDVNNDGYVDIVQSKSSDLPEYNHRTYINNAANGDKGWTRTTSWDAPGGPDTDLSKGASLVDLNGDGLPDIVYIKQNENHIKMNDSKNWTNSDLMDGWNNYFSMDVYQNNYQFADINGDGLADMIVTKTDAMPERRTLINTGSGWFSDSAWELPDGEFKNLGTRLLDANADGMLDFMV
ncbi:MAG: SpvB/TcaC N-terminal domain-containing protein, partial [Candidatus Omnitrophota bacterium]|nr:SpvB/TcaC N-terminal domain-containing protein [Candidatus Omnitrophota bacterium]